ncbi:MAG: hypothetical protein EI684_04905 [Candidatus Viridilinea halotolerans]|uniref:Uncharacterized protein n=1 Tax=Candidatus Viridilinea halotolerans TaxID=2491704 RepID=A0A426U5W7_9CHLR|nr:MAG: hypothetical protein EI684_04905 [Candidatus Viridilinea halotolerans]
MFIEDRSEAIRSTGPVKGQHLPDGWRFCLFAVAHMYTMQTGLQSYLDVTALLNLDGEGHILDDMDHVNIVVTQRPGLTSEEAHLQAAATANALPATLKAISAMHLRCPVDEVTPSATAQKRAAKHGGIAKLHTYYVLRVKPTVPTSAEDFKDVGMPERIGASAHKVRGHFRYYHPDRPMFGRISGSVGVPDHERGSDDYGGIKKDYQV